MYWFTASQETNRAKLAAFFQEFKKTMRALRANETNVTPRNASKNDKKTFF